MTTRPPDPRPTVLVVDDETGILESLSILLRNEGFDPQLAHGGKKGLEMLGEFSPDIVLTDIRMPNVTGVEILAAARQNDPDVPVILMTAQATLQSAMQAVNEGAFYYIQKPFRNDELIAILKRAAEHRQLRVENKSLKQEIKRRERRHGDRPVGNSKIVARGARTRRDRGAHRDHGAHPGRVGHRQGSDRALHPRAVHAHGGAVPFHQLRRAPREPARERAVRSREGLVHRRREGQDRAVRAPRPRARSSSTRSARRRRPRRSSCCACCSTAR